MELLIRWSWTFGLAGAALLAGSLAGGFLNGWNFAGSPTGLAVAGAVALVLYAVLDRERIGDTVQSRSFMYGSGSSVLVLLAAAIAVAVFSLARRNDHTWDLTRDHHYTLSDHSAQVLGGLNADIMVTAFVRNGSAQQRELVSLTRLVADATPHVEATYVDPLAHPLQASQANVTGDQGTVLVASGDNERRLEWPVTEEELLSAVVMVTAGEDHRICWAAGHGEPDPDDEFTERGLGGARLALEALNYQVMLQRVATEGLDLSCEALIVARPTVEWQPAARESLAAYLAGGGRVMMMLEPGDVPELAAELERYGIRVGDDVVLDVNLKNQLMGVDDPSVVVLSERDFSDHPVTRSLGAAVVLPIARSVVGLRTSEGLVVRDLMRTSPDAWAETDPEAAEVGPDEGIELVGEVPVVVAVEIEDPAVIAVADPAGPDPAAVGVPASFTPAPGGRLVVIGDSDFASNSTLMLGNNRDLFLNTVAWLVDEEDQLGERPENGDTLEISAFGEGVMCLFSVFLVPGAAALIAGATLLRRRYL